VRTIANGPVMDVFAQFDLQKIALLLDVDGTIVDIGPSPTEVHVGAGLLETLKRLFALMDGALALVSGRPIGDLDRLFAPLRLPTIGGHGAEMRLRDNEVFFWAKPLPHDLRKRLAESTGIGSGVVVEDLLPSLRSGACHAGWRSDAALEKGYACAGGHGFSARHAHHRT